MRKSVFSDNLCNSKFFLVYRVQKTKYFSKLNKYLKQKKSFVFGNHYFSANYIRKLENYKSIDFLDPNLNLIAKLIVRFYLLKDLAPQE